MLLLFVHFYKSLSMFGPTQFRYNFVTKQQINMAKVIGNYLPLRNFVLLLITSSNGVLNAETHGEASITCTIQLTCASHGRNTQWKESLKSINLLKHAQANDTHTFATCTTPGRNA